MVRAFLCLALLTALGCTGHRPPPGPPMAEQYPVHGKITIKGQPLIGGVVYFSPAEVETGSGTVRYEVASLVDAQGRYVLGFNGNKKGAPAGTYKVYVTPRDTQELKNSNSRTIPHRCREAKNTPLTAEVKEQENVLNFELH
jgi:hypothetical protein